VDEIIPLMAEGKILPYLDIPFQHASPRILKAMKRPAAAENTLARIRAWREICPELVIRSTFITGFPGETEDDFQQLMNFIDDAELDRVGCFTYSAVDGATANALPDHVPDEVKEERRARLMERQADISADRLAARIGQTMTVLIDEISEEGAIGRSYADAPEIDGVVVIEDGTDLVVGEFVTVEITDSGEHDLWGEVI
jgi:ribosomal protein S12 methylthiotransferase